MANQKSALWNFFKPQPDKFAKCNLCRKNISHKSSITNLKKHLKHKHMLVYKSFMEELPNNSSQRQLQKQRTASESAQSFEMSAQVSGTSAQSTADAAPEEGALTVNADLKVAAPKRQKASYVPIKIEPCEKQSIDEALLDLFTLDFQPFSVVEDKGFKSFVRRLNPSYALPDRKHISSVLIPGLYKQHKELMMDEINKYAKAVCLTMDSWTCKKNDSYLAVTAHFLKEETDTIAVRAILLHCEQFSGSHTSVALANSLTSITEEWAIADKVTFAVSDNAINITNAIKLKGWPFFGCYVHKLNLIVQNSLKPVDGILLKVRKIVTHFKKSKAAAESLINYQKFQKICQPLAVKNSVPTRWNSVFYMLERFCQLQEALQAVIPDLKADLPTISAEEWTVIQQICTVLKPFEEVTSKMSGENYLSASMAIVLTDGLKYICKQLKDEGFYGAVLEVLIHLEFELKLRYDNIDQEPAIALCTYLDPRFKEHAFNSATVVYDTRQNLIEHIRREICASTPPAASAPVAPASVAASRFCVWTKMDMKLNAIMPSSTSAFDKAEQELDMYNKEGILERNSCPLEWWRSRKYIYPNLYKIFKEKCHIVVTSVPCEGIFSKAGYMMSDRRTRLSAKRASELIFLNANSKTQ